MKIISHSFDYITDRFHRFGHDYLTSAFSIFAAGFIFMLCLLIRY